jgi:DNA-binding transcriptional MerR regulator
VAATLAIGDFSRATHLSVKTLRHYHDIGLLEPVEVDLDTGYRRYGPSQIGTALVIRRFRNLEMPLEEIHAVLDAPDVESRNVVIAAHLARLEASLTRTQEAVASVRDLLEQSPTSDPIRYQHMPATPAASITETVDQADALLWYRGAIAELAATLAAQGLDLAGPAGGIFSDQLFTEARGEATIFLPCSEPVRPVGRVASLIVPQVELATIVHAGSHTGIDRTYGALGAYVAKHALAVDAPMREYYVVGPIDTEDETLWRTEVCWPVLKTSGTG